MEEKSPKKYLRNITVVFSILIRTSEKTHYDEFDELYLCLELQ